MKKIISFDIWDTIIKRKCHPEEVKLYTAKYILLKYQEKLKEKYKDIYEILKKRNEIETEICNESEKNGYDSECRIIDVFLRLQKTIFTEGDAIDISLELLEAEIEQEKRVIYINPDILPIFEKYKDLKMYCISDFYMGSKELRKLLEHLNLNIKIEKIFSSADYLLNKRTGRLYKKAEEELKISPSEHIHVGDNPYSDIESAKNIGIEAIKIEKKNINFSPTANRKKYIDFENLIKEQKSLENKLYNSGLNIGNILYYFVYDVVEYAIKNKFDVVYYCTREGETFIKIHEMIKKNNPFGVKVPDCRVLEVSRMATFSASMKEFSIAELLRLWSQYREQSMNALFKTLAINIEKYKKFFGKYDITVKEKIKEPWFDIRIQNLCRDDEFTNMINQELKHKREELMKYFKTVGIENDGKSMLTVDIGWRGTIQDNIAYIYNKNEITGCYLTLYDYYNAQPVNAHKEKFISDKKIINNEVSNIITLLEWIYNPGTGSVVEYKDGEAIRKAKSKETDIVKKYIKPLQDGMFDCAEIINEYMAIHPYESKENLKDVYQIIKNLEKHPSEEIVEAYYSMVFNDTFGTGDYVKKNDLNFWEKINVLKCRKILRNEIWKEAFIIHNNIEYINLVLKFKSNVRKILGRNKK